MSELARAATLVLGNSIIAIAFELARYARAHHDLYGVPLARDGSLAVEWLRVAKALVMMLNGETGHVDRAHALELITDIVTRAGFDRSSLDE